MSTTHYYWGFPTAGPQLLAPASPQATATSPTSLSVTASSVANATGYKLFFNNPAVNATYTQIGGTLATPSYAHTGLIASTTYYYKWQTLGNGSTYLDSALGAVFPGVTATAPLPAISSFSPASAEVGASVTVTGTNFTGVTSVKVGSLVANFSVLSVTRLVLSVPAGAITGTISVTNAGGTAVSGTALTITAPVSTTPTISVFSPSSGLVGTLVTISGVAFGATTGTVKFNGILATVNQWTANQIIAVAPANGTGYVTVTTAGGVNAVSIRQFLLIDPAPFDLNTAVWGESGVLAYQGAVETDNAYATDVPVLSVPGTAAVATTLAYSAPFTPVLPHFGVEINITKSFDPGTGATPAGTQDFVDAGYNFATNGFIGMRWVAQTGQLFYRQVLDTGVETNLLAYSVPLLPPFALACSIADRSWTTWLKTPTTQTLPVATGGTFTFQAGQWYVVGAQALNGNAAFDFRTTAMLASISRAVISIGSGGNAGKTFDISGGRAGYLLGVGTANYAPVKFADGTPYAQGARAFIGGSVATAGALPNDAANGIHTCFAAIFDVDLVNNTIRQWAKIGFKRTLSDGVERVIGDNSVQFRYVAANDSWYAYAGRWGTITDAGETMGISVYRVAGSVLPKGAVALSGFQMNNLPAVGGGYPEDPDMMYLNGLYHFVWSTNNAQNFTVHYATTPNLPDQNAVWTTVASGLTSTAIQEGCHFTIEGGALRIISTYAPGGGVNSRTRIYDTGQAQAGVLTQVGEWTRQDFAESPSPTHGNETAIREVDADGSVFTAYYWCAFGGEKFNNAAYSWGNFHILRATRRKAGYPYPLLTLPA